MIIGALITVLDVALVRLVFFRFHWLRWSITWAVVSGFVGAHLVLIFLIGVRYVAPYSTDAHVVQHSIQLIPRLPEPTLVTAVLVEPNAAVKKGQPLFQFDRRRYEYQVDEPEAELASALQAPTVTGTNIASAVQAVIEAKSALSFAESQERTMLALEPSGAVSRRRGAKVAGIHALVAGAKAKLDSARYYLDNTTLVAPEDGSIVNLQVRPGMVAGILRAGAIASLICDADRYVLASYDQEILRNVEPGQAVEIALVRYPGQIFRGKVDAIWPSGAGQYLPSGRLPTFGPPPPEAPDGRFAVKIRFAEPDVDKFRIGAQGATAIYTGGGGFAALRRIGIRSYAWLSWLYPIPFSLPAPGAPRASSGTRRRPCRRTGETEARAARMTIRSRASGSSTTAGPAMRCSWSTPRAGPRAAATRTPLRAVCRPTPTAPHSSRSSHRCAGRPPRREPPRSSSR